ncbi:hypothetical protein PGTUg99_008387 [Puccinia graminis f. sp. tritici]|uniref:Uncharacterized protein n=1 Tax=Puccinia graminis f. sp. tritici TaxID=56615 RepID=A0A5B0SI56_PUCGR|nr:hypothetical protein PGTUg99_009151 [Puccinia graminis f. sp. tritici]KAA1137169.1 hypothetical protein PGTUg99_008387 [Puccinia graminis f. sp. tritici]
MVIASQPLKTAHVARQRWGRAHSMRSEKGGEYWRRQATAYETLRLPAPTPAPFLDAKRLKLR